ncbi:MAG: extracellular solute-binding protein [Treponema sp.]|jgi:raffinose/stachyose/melibiose transport system substrate-binding protein|nr:extracellular solute-binding protein [Treponema sp.]
MKKVKKCVFMGLLVLLGIGHLYAGGQKQSDGRIKIEYFSLKRETAAIMDGFIADFEKEFPNVRVEQTNVPDPARILSTRMSSNDTPEIFSSWPNESWRTQVREGYVMDLSDFSAISRIREDAREYCKVNGKDYIIPISYNTMSVIYNKDIFDRYGLSSPKNWAEMMTICATLKKNGITPFLITGKDLEAPRQDFDVYLLTIASWQAFRDDVVARKADMTKPYGAQLRELAGRILQLVEYAQSDILGSGRDQLLNDFAAGKGAMLINGSWSIPPILNANSRMNFSMFPFPAVDGSKTMINVYPGDFALCVSAQAKHPNESRAFIEYLTRPNVARIYAEKDGSISCIKGVDYVAPQLKEMSDFIQTTGRVTVYPTAYWTMAQLDGIGAAVQQLYMDKNIDNFLRNVQTNLNSN